MSKVRELVWGGMRNKPGQAGSKAHATSIYKLPFIEHLYVPGTGFNTIFFNPSNLVR